MITVSSSVLVDDAETPVSRFAAFTLDKASAQAMESLRDEAAIRYGLSFTGSGLRDAKALLNSVAVTRLVNGEPDVTLDGVSVAGAVGQGELVTLEFGLYSRASPGTVEPVRRTGVITDLVWSGGPGGPLVQRVDFVFHVAQRLVLRVGGAVIVFTDPGVV